MMCLLTSDITSERSPLIRRQPIIQHDQVVVNTVSASNGQEKHNSKWCILLIGQSIALSLSCANAASSTLENKYEIRVPTFQTGIVYFILSFHLLLIYWRRRRERIKEQQHQHTMHNNKIPLTHIFSLHTPYTTYILLAMLDVEANYLAMLSFQHTSLSSSMLLTSLSVLSTVILRPIIFKTVKYSTKRLFGVGLCLIGGCLWLRFEFYHGRVTAEDNDDTTNVESNYPIVYGDLLAIFAACIYGLNDVAAEYYIKKHDKVEYLGMIGLFGAIFSFGIQVPLLEREEVWRLFVVDGIEIEAWLLFLCFIILLCYFYVSAMNFLSLNDATLLNLSLQTGPLWAVILSMVDYSKNDSSFMATPPLMTYIVSLSLIMVGMFLYESNSEDDERSCGESKNNIHAQANVDRDREMV